MVLNYFCWKKIFEIILLWIRRQSDTPQMYYVGGPSLLADFIICYFAYLWRKLCMTFDIYDLWLAFGYILGFSGPLIKKGWEPLLQIICEIILNNFRIQIFGKGLKNFKPKFEIINSSSLLLPFPDGLLIYANTIWACIQVGYRKLRKLFRKFRKIEMGRVQKNRAIFLCVTSGY